MPNKLPSILLGGLVAGILSTSYLGLINFLCCLGVVLGGLAASWHYTNENQVTIPGGQGALLGALAALVGMVIAYLLGHLLSFIGIPDMQEIQSGFMARFMPPEQIEQMEEAQRQQEEQGFTAMTVLFTAIGAVVMAIFGAIGGAIGAAVFKKGPAEPETF